VTEKKLTPSGSDDTSEHGGSRDYFDLLLDESSKERKQKDLTEELCACLDGWQRAHSDKAITQDMFPFPFREAWIELFIRYNTPLPSSAAVERLFNSAGDILRPKRSSLSSSNFEKLVFMRGNMELLKL
jgi:hypothetical protein